MVKSILIEHNYQKNKKNIGGSEFLINGTDFQHSVPISQLVPVNPTLQLHWYELTPSMQVAPFRHGLLPHSFTSELKASLEKKH